MHCWTDVNIKKWFYLDSDAVILVPDVAVVDPHISPWNIEAVRVEGGHVDDAVMVLVRPLSTENQLGFGHEQNFKRWQT